MSTDIVEDMSPHLRGVTVTTLAAFAGLVAGGLSHVATGGDPSSDVGLLVLLGAILAQFPVLHVLGIEYEGLSTKDKIYVAFMTFAMWFVSWGILLTTAQG